MLMVLSRLRVVVVASSTVDLYICSERFMRCDVLRGPGACGVVLPVCECVH